MKRAKASLRVSANLILVFFALTANAPAQSIPDEVQSVLEEYASLDPISIHCKGAATFHLRGTDQEFSTESSYCRQGHCFSWMSDLREGRDSVEKNICRFDGEVVFSIYGEDSATLYNLTELNETGPKRKKFDLPYFEAVGIYCPTRQGNFSQGGLQSNILYLIQNGAELVSCEETRLEQENVIRIELIAKNAKWEEVLATQDKRLESAKKRLNDNEDSQEKLDELLKVRENLEKTMPHKLRWVYYLSPANQYAVLKHERLTMEGRVTASYINSSFQLIPETNITLAGSVTMNGFEYIGSQRYELLETPFQIQELSVAKASTDKIPHEQFAANMDEIPPGATVVDGVNPDLRLDDGTVSYFEMPASPDDLDAKLGAASSKYGFSSRTRYLIIINAVIFVLLAGYLIYSKRKSHRD